MILQKMTDEELDRIAPLVEVHIPEIETRTGFRRKFILEVLLVSTYYLMREQGKDPISLDHFIAQHCQRTASALGISLFDTIAVIETWVILTVQATPPGKEGLNE